MVNRKRKTTKRKRRTISASQWRKWQKKWKKMLNGWYGRIGKWTTWGLIALVVGFIGLQLWQRQIDPTPNQIGSGESVASKTAFVKRLVPTAQALHKEYGVLPSISLAQAMVESNFGQSQLAARYFNLFGVKTGAQDPNGVDLETQEFQDGQWVTIVDRFKVYRDWEDSLRQHAELIFHGTSWNASQYQEVLQGKTYVQQAQGLQSSGYATDPDYAQKLITMIEEWNLAQYDR